MSSYAFAQPSQHSCKLLDASMRPLYVPYMIPIQKGITLSNMMRSHIFCATLSQYLQNVIRSFVPYPLHIRFPYNTEAFCATVPRHLQDGIRLHTFHKACPITVFAPFPYTGKTLPKALGGVGAHVAIIVVWGVVVILPQDYNPDV